MPSLRSVLIEGIDAVRERDNFAPLEKVMLRYIASRGRGLSVDELNAARNESLLAVLECLRRFETSPAIAEKLPRIMRNKSIDVLRERARAVGGWVPESAADFVDTRTELDPTHLEVATSDLLDRVVAALPRLAEEHPRYFLAIQAKFNGLDVAAVLTEHYGPTSRSTADQITHRARRKLKAYVGEGVS